VAEKHPYPLSAGPPLIVVGASARAFAQSARRAGFAVHAADLFADSDLRAVAASVARVPAERYPDGLLDLVAPFPAAPWSYTGALENRPDLLERLAAVRPLAGCSPAAVRLVRDPFRLAVALHEAGLQFPHTFPDPAQVPLDGSYVQKPLASAAGHGIRRWTADLSAADSAKTQATLIWQQWIEGEAVAAIFLLSDTGAELLGTSHQLLGRDWCHARGLLYCGSVDVPLPLLTESIRRDWDAVGRLLAETGGLRGVVGVDAVADRAGRLTVIEVNPRPTASLELIERRTGRSLAGEHLRACGFPYPAPELLSGAADPASPTCWAKAILRAPHSLNVDDGWLEKLAFHAAGWCRQDGWPAVADLPESGEPIPLGGPVLTLLAPGHRPEAALLRLIKRCATLSAALFEPTVLPNERILSCD
jgi:predicted ATP-grasp superfamily ATP-dependent carboligase